MCTDLSFAAKSISRCLTGMVEEHSRQSCYVRRLMRRATVAPNPRRTRSYWSLPCDVDGHECLAHEIEVLKFR
jgi:hypothetical protein